jgi:hypothetical protein
VRRLVETSRRIVRRVERCDCPGQQGPTGGKMNTLIKKKFPCSKNFKLLSHVKGNSRNFGVSSLKMVTVPKHVGAK